MSENSPSPRSGDEELVHVLRAIDASLQNVARRQRALERRVRTLEGVLGRLETFLDECDMETARRHNRSIRMRVPIPFQPSHTAHGAGSSSAATGQDDEAPSPTPAVAPVASSVNFARIDAQAALLRSSAASSPPSPQFAGIPKIQRTIRK